MFRPGPGNEDKKISVNIHFESCEIIWKMHACKGLLKQILVLLREYANTLSSDSHHRDAIKKILQDYDGQDGYLKKHRNTPVCNPVFLLLQIPLHIDTIDSTDRLIVILEAIKTQTGMDVFAFFKRTEPFYLALKQDKDSVIKKMLQCNYFAHFMLKNPEIFLPHASKEETSLSILIQLESLKKRCTKEKQDFLEKIINPYKKKSTRKNYLISLILNLDRIKYPHHTEKMENEIFMIFDHTVKYLAKKNHQYLIDLFESSTKNAFTNDIERFTHDSYRVPTYLFFSIHHLNIEEIKSPANYPVMMKEIRSALKLEKKFLIYENTLFLKIIDRITDEYNEIIKYPDKHHYYAENLKEILYNIYSINNLVECFHEVDDKISEKLDIDFEQLLLYSICKFDLATTEYLLRIKTIDLKKSFISYTYNNYIASSFNFNKDNSIKMTLIQALLKIMLRSDVFINPGKSASLLNILQLFISHTPDCVNQFDSMKNSIFYYLRQLMEKKSECKDYATSEKKYNQICEIIDAISDLICETYCMNNILPFMLAMKKEQLIQENFHNDLIFHIYLMQLASFKNFIQKELDYRKLQPGQSLSHDESVELFENAVDTYKYHDAIKVFCIANKIADDSNEKDFVLTRLCHLIKKPVNSVYIFKLLVHLNRTTFRQEQNDKIFSSYISLWNIKPFINDWGMVKNKFNKMFGSTKHINVAIGYALNTPGSLAIRHLLEEKKYQIRKSGLTLTPLQAIITETHDRFLPHDDQVFNDYAQSLQILHDIIEKMFYYDKTYLTECNDAGHDIFYFLRQLKYSLSPELHEKVDAIINLVHQQKKECLFRANAGLLFFHPESAYSTMPRDVVAEVASLSPLGMKR